jgi:hypothetical protein
MEKRLRFIKDHLTYNLFCQVMIEFEINMIFLIIIYLDIIDIFAPTQKIVITTPRITFCLSCLFHFYVLHTNRSVIP